MKNTFFLYDDPPKKRFHVGVHRFSATHQRTLTYVESPRGPPLPPSNDKGTEKGNVRFFQKQFFAIKKIARQQKSKIKKHFTFFLIIALGERGTFQEGMRAVT